MCSFVAISISDLHIKCKKKTRHCLWLPSTLYVCSSLFMHIPEIRHTYTNINMENRNVILIFIFKRASWSNYMFQKLMISNQHIRKHVSGILIYKTYIVSPHQRFLSTCKLSTSAMHCYMQLKPTSILFPHQHVMQSTNI